MDGHPSRRRVLCTAGGLALVGLAGCTSDDSSDDGSGDGDSGDDDGTGSGIGDDTGESDPGTGDGALGDWGIYRLDQAGTYEYDYETPEFDGSFVFSIVEANGDTGTIALEGDFGGMPFSERISTTSESIISDILQVPIGAIASQTLFAPFLGQVSGSNPSVGDSWSVDYEDGSSSFEVTAEDTHLGISCYEMELRSDGEVVYEACLSPAHGMVLRSRAYEDDGRLAFGVTLTAYDEEPRDDIQ